MTDFFKRIKTNSILTALLYSALGLVLLIRPDLSISVLCTALGVILLICGLVDVSVFLTNRDGSLYSAFHLIAGVVLAALGLWIMTRPTLIISVIPRIIGALICIHGVCDIADAMTLRRSGSHRWNTALILAVLTLILGGILVIRPFGVLTTAVRVIGIFLLYDGISDLWITACVSGAVRQARRDAETQAGAVDTDFTDVKDDGK